MSSNNSYLDRHSAAVDAPPFTGTQLWRDDANAGSFPISDFAQQFYPSYRPLTHYSFYLNARDSNALRTDVQRHPDYFNPLPGPPPPYITGDSVPRPSILSPSAPHTDTSQAYADSWVAPPPRSARGIHPFNRTAGYVPVRPATPEPAPLPLLLFGRRLRLVANPAPRPSEPTISGGAPTQYNGAEKGKYMVETWVGEDDLECCTKGRQKKGTMRCYKKDNQVKRHPKRAAKGHRRVRLYLQEFYELNRVLKGRGEAEEKLPKKCKENGWMDFATTIGEHFLNGGGSKEDGLVNMGGGSEVDNGEEYESDGEEED